MDYQKVKQSFKYVIHVKILESENYYKLFQKNPIVLLKNTNKFWCSLL